MTNAEREAIARKARRRQAVTVLRVGETVCGYAAAQLADGLPPDRERIAGHVTDPPRRVLTTHGRNHPVPARDTHPVRYLTDETADPPKRQDVVTRSRTRWRSGSAAPTPGPTTASTPA